MLTFPQKIIRELHPRLYEYDREDYETNTYPERHNDPRYNRNTFMILTESGKLFFCHYKQDICMQLPLNEMGVKGDTKINCISNKANDLG